MDRFVAWFKANGWWLMILVVAAVIAKDYFLPRAQIGIGTDSVMMGTGQLGAPSFETADLRQSKIGIMPPYEPQVPPVVSDDRLVIAETYLSVQVDDVAGSIKKIEKSAVERGGFLVSSNLDNPEGAETGSIVIRVPIEKREEMTDEIKKLGVRVVSENVSGTDVTDQFVDLEGRLATLNATKTKLEALLARAEEVTEILNVQRELSNLQLQIDQLKGQQKYLEGSAKLTRITTYLATDELALPYTPDEAWRPGVIFKLAVRSLVSSIRDLGSLLIWLLVYSPLWLPVLILIWWFKRKRSV